MEKSRLGRPSEEHVFQSSGESGLSRALARQELGISNKGDATTPLGSLFHHSHNEFFSYPDKIFPEAISVICLLSCHCASLWREYLPFLYNYLSGTGRQ